MRRQIVLRRVRDLPATDTATRVVDGVPMVTLAFYEAWQEDMRELHAHDVEWARRTALDYGVDLAALSGSDPSYRADFRA